MSRSFRFPAHHTACVHRSSITQWKKGSSKKIRAAIRRKIKTIHSGKADFEEVSLPEKREVVDTYGPGDGKRIASQPKLKEKLSRK